uniref:Inhibitor of growth protein n=1 Tax=Meloidogyne incognita TaxID=6306 RepID=A0A914LHM4_MELIC
MASDLYEKCLKNARPVQQKMDSNMLSIRHLDIKYKLKEQEAKKKIMKLVCSWNKLNRQEQRRNYEEIEECFAQARSFCDKKIIIASETYELVDSFIQKLDSDTSKFNTILAQKQQQQFNEIEEKGKKQTPSTSRNVFKKEELQQSNKTSKHVTPLSPVSTTSRKARGTSSAPKKRKRTDTTVTEDISDVSLTTVTASQTPLIMPGHCDMPVDPNEPRYCICQQVSFGSMVCCDNKNCLIEWFHFPCVGLTTSPKGKWYCPQCRDGKESNKPLKRENINNSMSKNSGKRIGEEKK